MSYEALRELEKEMRGIAPTCDPDWEGQLTDWADRLAILSSRQEVAPVADDAALREFTAYFVKNYPGPNTIISNPNWHAPKIFRAAKYAIDAAMRQEAGDGT